MSFDPKKVNYSVFPLFDKNFWTNKFLRIGISRRCGFFSKVVWGRVTLDETRNRIS
jgi:hypothetical protein